MSGISTGTYAGTMRRIVILCVVLLALIAEEIDASSTVPVTGNTTSLPETDASTSSNMTNTMAVDADMANTTSSMANTTVTDTTATVMVTDTTVSPTTLSAAITGDVLGSDCTLDSNCTHPMSRCYDGVCSCQATYIQINDTTCVKESSAVVGNIAVYNRTGNMMYITWEEPDVPLDNVTYRVSWMHIFRFNSNATGSLNATSAMLWSLIPGDLYNVTVTTRGVAFDGRPINVMSDIQQFRTIPEAPTLAIDGDIKGQRIRIRWGRLTIAYVTYLGTLTSETSVLTINTTNDYQVFDVIIGTNYTLMLVKSAGPIDAQNSTVAELTFIPEPDVPDPPANVTAENLQQTEFTLRVVEPMLTNGNLTGYQFAISFRKYYDLALMNLKEEYRTLTNDNLYIFNESIIPGANYLVQVKAVNDFFNGTTSTDIEIKTQEDVPGKVENLMVSESVNKIDITWTRPANPNGDIVGYFLDVTDVNNSSNCHFIKLCHTSVCNPVFFNVTTNGNCQNKEQLIGSMVNYSWTLSVVEDRNYTVSVTAYTAVGGGMAASLNIMTKSLVPTAPGNLHARPYSNYEPTFLLQWDSPVPFPGRTTYTVFLFDDVLKNTRIVCNGITATLCRIDQVEEYWPYILTVQAKTAKGTSSNSTSHRYVTQRGANPGKVTNLANSFDCQLLKISWDDPLLRDRNGPISEYRIRDLATQKVKIITVKSNDDYRLESSTYNYEFDVQESTQYKLQLYAYYSQANINAVSINFVTPECGPPAGTIVGVVVAFIILLAVSLAVICFIYKRKLKELERRFPTEYSPQTEIDMPPNNDDEDIESERPFTLSAVKAVFDKKSADQNRIFSLEYEDVKKLSPKHSTEFANMEGSHNSSGNKAKNRYVNVLPFDHSRVSLSVIDDDKCSDYINANYIPGYTYEREYIASQGPLPGTVVDFWRMIWEKSVTVIVMLTKCKEGNTDKCEHYWPDAVNEPKQYGDVVVNMVSVSNMDKFDINIFHVSQGEYTKTVKHFHFLEWPDFSASVSSTVVIDFTQTVRTHITPEVKGPVLVHCSAGVGRTGTFISVDYLLQFVRDSDLSAEVDIFDWVLQMRNNRSSMVQVEKQYIFIHQALLELVERKEKGLIKSEDIDLKISNEIVYENTAFEGDDDEDEVDEDSKDEKAALYDENHPNGEPPQTTEL